MDGKASVMQVYLSYETQSRPIVEKIYKELQSWGHKPWMDVENIPKGIENDSTAWMEAIDNGLLGSRVMIACMTPAALKSQNVRQEWAWALLAKRRIIFLRLEKFDKSELPSSFYGIEYIYCVDRLTEGLAEAKQLLDASATSDEESEPLDSKIVPSAIRRLSELDELDSDDPNYKTLHAQLEPYLHPFVGLLHDDSRHVRFLAAEALGQLGDQRAGDPLITASSKFHNSAMLEALGKLGDPRAIDVLIRHLYNRREHFHATRHAAAKALAQLGEIAFEPLLSAIYENDWYVSSQAAYGLGQLGDPRAVEPLITILEDKSVEAVGMVAENLGLLGDIRAVEPLILSLHDEKSYVRRGAALGLGHLGDARAIVPLTNVLSDKISFVRKAAAIALKQLGWIPTTRRLAAEYAIAMEDWDSVVLLADVAVYPLINALGDASGTLRGEIAQTLGRLGDIALTPLLDTLSSAETKNLQRGAVLALGYLGNERALEPLLEILDKKITWLLATVLEALGLLGDRRAVEPVVTFLESSYLGDNLLFRAQVVHVLGKLGDVRAVDPIANILQISTNRVISDSVVRSMAAKALGQLDDPKSLKYLLLMLDEKHHQEDENVIRAAIGALGELGNLQAVTPLISLLDDVLDSSFLSSEVAEALGKLGDPQAINPLINLLTDKRLRFSFLDETVSHYAAEALRKIGTPEALQALRDAGIDEI